LHRDSDAVSHGDEPSGRKVRKVAKQGHVGELPEVGGLPVVGASASADPARGLEPTRGGERQAAVRHVYADELAVPLAVGEPPRVSAAPGSQRSDADGEPSRLGLCALEDAWVVVKAVEHKCIDVTPTNGAIVAGAERPAAERHCEGGVRP
jgi:hypothetical protein